MWFDLRKEDLTFIQRAPVVHTAEAVATAARNRVFAAFADAEHWNNWFPSVRAAAYTSPPPHGVGTIREAHVGRTHWIEEMIGWDEAQRYAWTVTRASVPLAAALVESYEFADAGSGTRVRWSFALEPRMVARLGGPFMGRVLTRLLHRAIQNLDAELARSRS